ncbi:MAG: ATP-grasp domain-containing protein [Bullifex sp.]|nr:ATP-grasp domain-containing protein [Spirochaetales bacterium]MDY3850757.1 ATP-grasp domain-containing protein [Bullifex sp.]MDD7535366.1 ATP-grasp domain-containing protein [Spirochaetales bacterium]MDY5056428.1 ATP-grasp domain-containing protein [Bullifex sp.]MDY5776808.1 ATP-grasp domain-containing protein [Bullifex sp.]
MNFIFISPQFPHTYWNFCARLKKNGINVLGIGDTPYDQLSQELRNSLTEYYRVNDMENYDEMFRAVAFFSYKYGRIDWLESNNEYWLEQDARLRTDFNITTGVNTKGISKYKSKYEMKKYYAKAGVPTARISKVTDLKKAKAFLEEIGGYPIIAKPECGVGAAHTYKITKDAELEEFFATRPDVAYVMEEFIEGDIVSYDVITDNRCEPLFESMTCWPPSIADIVNNKLDLDYYTAATVPEELRTLGRATVKAFDVKSRFVHLEFFCLRKNKKGLGKKGDFVGLEVNMRPAGGYTPDMMNWAHATDVYQIWADMVAFNERRVPDLNMDHCCVYASRRDCYQYKHSWDEVMEKYRDKIVMAERLPALWYDAMGNYMFTAHADDDAAAEEFIAFVEERA